ncbi:Conserved protein of uncharacterised function, possible phage protein [Mycobacteroides abscessus subsp. bolletii]|nr:Conserved protein of uncharacterised function, possible phage protein [Mycobacteroides abscessus subsp. bolletii]SHT27226.1 Conserved protein of uncharacterised function, possible phage protein [Mycobacteroides abscessus subsp. bolletii]SHT60072.1 Conserved protein of uncharacterised function, possible phage protein [Mycobacteroides abscessus subsp. bolletii]SKH04921.1 Conserved protein of uncharacterised function, possible phage protein [Mycobacteroides abscessus subsp. bolletii]SKH14928.1 
MATQFRPEALRAGAERLMALLNPDGQFSDADRARRRGITIGPQGFDGMSAISGLLDPETRAYLDTVFAKLAAPGMCNPNDQSPLVDGEPADDAAERDTRTVAQRHHDALRAALRSTLVSTELGSHHGLPVTVIVTTTLKELQDAAGIATTGSGTRLPMRDLIWMATHAHHYLAIFDDHGRALHLGRSQRIASPGSAPRATRPRPWLHPPRLPCARIPLPSPPHHRMRPRRPHRHRQPNKSPIGPLGRRWWRRDLKPPQSSRKCLLPADMGFILALTDGVQCRKFAKSCGVLLTASTPVNVGPSVAGAPLAARVSHEPPRQRSLYTWPTVLILSVISWVMASALSVMPGSAGCPR